MAETRYIIPSFCNRKVKTMIKRWKVQDNEDVPHFLITVILLIYLEIDLAIKIFKNF